MGRPLRGRRIGWSSPDALSRARSARPTPGRPNAAIPLKGQIEGPVAAPLALRNQAVALAPQNPRWADRSAGGGSAVVA